MKMRPIDRCRRELKREAAGEAVSGFTKHESREGLRLWGMSKFMRINRNGSPVIDLSACSPERGRDGESSYVREGYPWTKASAMHC